MCSYRGLSSDLSGDTSLRSGQRSKAGKSCFFFSPDVYDFLASKDSEVFSAPLAPSLSNGPCWLPLVPFGAPPGNVHSGLLWSGGARTGMVSLPLAPGPGVVVGQQA